MTDKETDDDKKKDTSIDTSKKEVDKETKKDQAAEDLKKKEKEGDGEKKEGLEVVDPYEKKLAELKKEVGQKSTALIEKNEKIADLKEKLENQGLDEEQIKEKVEEIMGSQMQSIKESQKKLDDALKIADNRNVTDALKDKAENNGIAKIYRHFFDTEVNKELPFEKQITQAVALGDHALADDEFKAEVEKANENAVKTTGRVTSEAGVPQEILDIANSGLFETKAGKKDFLDRYRKTHS